MIAHQDGRRDFRIAELAGVGIEHELGECAFQPGQPAGQQNEARAAQAGGGIEIHFAQRLAEIEMLLRLEIERRPVADPAELDIRRLVRAHRHILERQVGDHLQRRRQRILGAFLLGLQFAEPVFHRADPGDDVRNVPALGLRPADVLRQRVPLRLQRLGFRLRFAPARVEGNQGRALRRQAAARQGGVEGFGVVANPADIVHGSKRLGISVGRNSPTHIAAPAPDIHRRPPARRMGRAPPAAIRRPSPPVPPAAPRLPRRASSRSSGRGRWTPRRAAGSGSRGRPG